MKKKQHACRSMIPVVVAAPSFISFRPPAAANSKHNTVTHTHDACSIHVHVCKDLQVISTSDRVSEYVYTTCMEKIGNYRRIKTLFGNHRHDLV